MPKRYGHGAGGKRGSQGKCRRGEGVNTSAELGGYGSDDGFAKFCVCPRCGFRQPHERGVPCNEKKCPDCGIQMIREN